MAYLKISYTSQYEGTYYVLVHDQLNQFIDYSTGRPATNQSSLSNLAAVLTKTNLNTYVYDLVADSLLSGVYTVRIYRQNGSSPNILIDDLLSVGQTGWNSFTGVQTNPTDIIGAIETYEKRIESIYRIEIYLDSIQLGLRNGETGHCRIDFDEETNNIKINSFWRIAENISGNRFSIRGPAALGSKAGVLFSIPISASNKLFYSGKIESKISNILMAKNFYVTIDTSSQLDGRIGGYPVYTPVAPSTASGSVSVSISTSTVPTGVSFRTR